MRKKGLVYIVLAVLTIVLLFALQYNQKKELNWFQSYVTHHKIPYGTAVLTHVMDVLFKDQITQVNIPPFEYLKNNTNANGTYFFVNDDIDFGKAELETLLNWTAKGNTLFIATQGFEKQLMDTLQIDTKYLYAQFGQIQKQLHQLANPKIDTTHYNFTKDKYATYFSEIDTLNATVLSTVDYLYENGSSQEKNINALKQNFGNGQIIISSFPKAFTNYFILKATNKNYTAGLLSYIDATKPIYIDNHHKSGKTIYTSPLYIFLNTKEFKWAYYIALIGVLLYVIFEGKRKQRAIPVVAPLKNQSLAFTRTIADMYYFNKESNAIIAHKIDNFLEYIRSKFHLATDKQNEQFISALANRSNHKPEEIKALFNYINTLKKSTSTSNEELKILNEKIENFKLKAYGKRS